GYAWLDPIAIGKVLNAYGIPATPSSLARDPDEAGSVARPHLAKGDAVVLKIQSPDIVHKSEVGGVRLNLTTEAAVRGAARDIRRAAGAAKPDAPHCRRDGISDGGARASSSPASPTTRLSVRATCRPPMRRRSRKALALPIGLENPRNTGARDQAAPL